MNVKEASEKDPTDLFMDKIKGLPTNLKLNVGGLKIEFPSKGTVDTACMENANKYLSSILMIGVLFIAQYAAALLFGLASLVIQFKAEDVIHKMVGSSISQFLFLIGIVTWIILKIFMTRAHRRFRKEYIEKLIRKMDVDINTLIQQLQRPRDAAWISACEEIATAQPEP